MTSMRQCERCEGKLDVLARSDARFCSARCRVAANRALKKVVPAQLREADRWVRHSAKKVPLTCAGRPASSTNQATWTSFAQARASMVGVGMGFVLNGDGIVCIDLDHVLVNGVPNEDAQRLLDRLPRTYVEVSPSGDGLHVWGLGRLRRGRRVMRDGVHVEAYGAGRYITVTEKTWSVAPLADLSEALEALLA